VAYKKGETYLPYFPTRSVQLIFSKLLQHHISKLSTYFYPLSEVFKLQRQTQLCPKRSIPLM